MMRKTIIFLFILVAMAGLTACEDRFDYGIGDIPAGKGYVRFDVGYKNFTPALSRSAGDAIKDIKSLWIVIYNADGTLHTSRPVTDFTIDSSQPDEGSTSTDCRAAFSLALPNGRYRIYAVANADLTGENVDTEEDLAMVKATWSETGASENAQMFGWFVNGNNATARPDGFTTSEVVVKGNTSLHAWLHRAASKVTVAIDGSGLYDGVNIYIKSIQIKDIPRSCHIGSDNIPAKADELIADGEKFVIDPVADGEDGPVVTKETPLLYVTGQGADGLVTTDSKDIEQGHLATSPALYFYENMQGKGRDKRQVDENKDGIPDYSEIRKDDKPYGSYVEVEAYYVSTNEKRPGRGAIRYRFMLGKDVYTDYDAERNYHYRLTLLLNYFANDPDWHIEYDRQTLEVSVPRVFNYQGKVFYPDSTGGWENLNHNFMPGNKIDVLSYKNVTDADGKTRREEVPWTAMFEWTDDHGVMHSSDTPPAWLHDFDSGAPGSTQLDVKADVGEMTLVNINTCLSSAPSKGGNGVYEDLAKNGTANCYMVDSKGYYSFPLVYGNATEGTHTYYQPYATGDDPLKEFKDHMGNPIRSAYIADNEYGYVPQSAELVWQDEEELVTGIAYNPGLYGDKGGIVFHVGDRIKQGNAIIAIKDDHNRVMWSWHIWVTNLNSLEETLEVTGSDMESKFDLMSVNLGWCCDENSDIRYYRRRECKVTITAGKLKEVRTVVQESHMAFPRGDNPYYQWGRKDPFVGTRVKWGNKPRYCGGDGSNAKLESIKWTGSEDNPQRMYDEYITIDKIEEEDTIGGKWPQVVNPGFYAGEERQPTKNIFHLMIQHPELFHNPPLKIGGSSYISVNDVSTNQWGSENETSRHVKTVYDPCPVGYQVPCVEVFSAFTTIPWQYFLLTDDVRKWMDVHKDQIADGNPTTNLYEFYTNRDKYKSIIFPQTGYRDWNDRAGVLRFGEGDADDVPNTDYASVGYCWTNNVEADRVMTGFASDAAYNFEFSRSHNLHGANGYVRPFNPFYCCDAFPVRPVRQK